MALIRRLVPPVRPREVLHCSLAQLACNAQIKLRVGISLICRLVPSVRGLSVVLVYTMAITQKSQRP
jgi:uncharacterized membrane protein YdcZ (DUF606 family)